MVMNEGVNICCKSATNQVFIVVSLIVELSTAISKSTGSIEAYPSIGEPSVPVTSKSPVISS